MNVRSEQPQEGLLALLPLESLLFLAPRRRDGSGAMALREDAGAVYQAVAELRNEQPADQVRDLAGARSGA